MLCVVVCCMWCGKMLLYVVCVFCVFVCKYLLIVKRFLFVCVCCCICAVSLPEWSKGLRSGRNVFELVGSNPTADILLVFTPQ